ncbi:hypothetical protein NESM_000678500 [Novymonas esmeraldas]|uniref:Uncharacterized protein n=1 Tax=Novymonas esmeraldas TaxID=1808958 RepID=A0AAW0EW61_9TRYP
MLQSRSTRRDDAVADTEVNCNHGKWNAEKRTCDCDSGWSTDWLNQDILSGNFVYCTSRASTSSPLPHPTDNATSPTSRINLILIVVGCAVAAAILCGVVVYCCCRRRKRMAKEEAKRSQALAAAEQEEVELRQRESLHLQLLQEQGEAAALQHHWWAVHVESQGRGQALSGQRTSEIAAVATRDPQSSLSPRRQQGHTRSASPLYQFRAPYEWDSVDGESGNAITDTLDGSEVQEPFAHHRSQHRRGAPVPDTVVPADYAGVPLSFYSPAASEASRWAARPPSYSSPHSHRRPPF